ncbi:pyrroloquinoline quinone precursor peptide PqqA [Streptomyces sp. CB03238]|nr:pyrroloquinoline quinone precursor peptide PqqA [Streptomyces sp. CB03238]ORT54871.1 coenzyme PQQ precursor peptide PqqA [Streptomyces sp. CB03238]
MQESASHEDAEERAAAPAVWQTPEYTVVETALEVTAYFLADR